jgi:CheY-like chemotaxis protein
MKLKHPEYQFENVLLLDDCTLDNFINEKIIETAHFSKRVYIHTSAQSVLEFLANLELLGGAYSSVFPQVLFIDINMPIMDGFQFLSLFKKSAFAAKNECRLVILTSSISSEDREKAHLIDKNIIFLNKPLNSEMLANIV